MTRWHRRGLQIPTSRTSDGISDGTEHWVIISQNITQILLAWLKNLGRCTQTSLLSPLIAHCSRPKNLFLCSYVKISKSVVICRICAISVPLKILYKTVFSYKSSWKVESAQLENFYFPVGKLFFLSWKIKICGHLSHLCHQRANEHLLQNRISV